MGMEADLWFLICLEYFLCCYSKHIDLSGYSLGLGYSFGNTKLDLTYDASSRESEYQFFNVGLLDRTIVDRKNSNITLSLSFNL